MGKINTYGTTTPPVAGDKVIGTDVNGSPTNATKNFLVEDIAALAIDLVTLQTALDAGNTATEDINLTGNITLLGGGMGVGTVTPEETLHVVGEALFVHTAAGTDEHALEIIVDAAGFGDIKALDIDYITGAISSGDTEGVILINVDETLAIGGEVFALEVLTTTEGTDDVIALKAGVGVAPISHDSGTFSDMDSLLVLAVDQLAALSSGGAGNVSVFVNDNDTITIGDAAQFDELEIIIDTGASSNGIDPVFEFSTGVGTWDSFTPTDGTNAFKNTGAILWDSTDLPSPWLVGTGAEFLIRITRTKNSLQTTPILDLVQIAAPTIYSWDKDANLVVNDVATATLSLTGTLSANASVGTAGQLLSSQGAGSPAQWVNSSSFVPDLASVLVAGNIATNENISLAGTGFITIGSGASSFQGSVSFADTILDGVSSAGGAGEILSSTGTGVAWIPASAGGNLGDTNLTADAAIRSYDVDGNTLEFNSGATDVMKIASASMKVGTSGNEYTMPPAKGANNQIFVAAGGAGESPIWADIMQDLIVPVSGSFSGTWAGREFLVFPIGGGSTLINAGNALSPVISYITGKELFLPNEAFMTGDVDFSIAVILESTIVAASSWKVVIGVATQVDAATSVTFTKTVDTAITVVSTTVNQTVTYTAESVAYTAAAGQVLVVGLQNTASSTNIVTGGAVHISGSVRFKRKLAV